MKRNAKTTGLLSRQFIAVVVMIFMSAFAFAQEIHQTNTDSLLFKGIELYHQGEFKSSLKYAVRGLELAPDYHDHRLLKIRNLQALNKSQQATADIFYLLRRKPGYGGLRDLAYRQVDLLGSSTEELDYLAEVRNYFPQDPGLNLLYAEKLFAKDKLKEARQIAQNFEQQEGLTGGDRYRINRILRGTIRNSIGINQNSVFFAEGYGPRKDWHTTFLEYKRMLRRTALLGRIQYFQKGDLSGAMIEVEAYPVVGERTYFYLNAGFSQSEVFPDLRASASVYHNLPVNLELELGGRMVQYENSIFIGVMGLSTYLGKSYLNLRAMLGPENEEGLVQNYQLNARYYFKGSDNYLYTKLSHGISPDDTAVYSQIEKDPALKANYASLGVHFSAGLRHVFRLEAGGLIEDTRSGDNGTQFLPSLGYQLRF